MRAAELEVTQALADQVLQHLDRARPLDREHELLRRVELADGVPVTGMEPVIEPIGSAAAVAVAAVRAPVQDPLPDELADLVRLDRMLDLTRLERPEAVRAIGAEKCGRVRSGDVELRQRAP